LYKQAQHKGLISLVKVSEKGFLPYLFGDDKYPLLPWIMTLHKANNIPCLSFYMIKNINVDVQ